VAAASILHVIDHLGVGGAQTFLVRVLPRLDPGEFHCTVLALHKLDQPAELLRDAGIEVVDGKCTPTNLPFRLVRVLSWAREKAPCLVHSHLGVGLGVGRFLASRLRVPALGHVQSPKFAPGLRAVVAGWGIRSADAVVACSRDIARIAHEAGWQPRLGVHVVVNPVDVAEIVAAKPVDLRAELGLTADCPLVIIVARLHPAKGLEVLIEAWRAVVREVPAHLAVVGDGPMAGELAIQVRSLGLESAVSFLGQRWEVAGLLKTCDVFVLPSRWEGMGIAAAEASAAGLPVVATHVGGIPEVIEDGVTGNLVQPERPAELAGALVALLSDPERRRAMGEAGRARMQRLFDVGVVAQQLTDLYRNCLAEDPGED